MPRDFAFAIVMLTLTPAGVRQQPASAPTPPDGPDNRPHIALAGFTMAADADVRDLWLATALEETLAWRLRRIDGLVTVPTARFSQVRREMKEGGGDAPPTAELTRLLGAHKLISGVCSTSPASFTLELTLNDPPERAAATARLSASSVFDLLDQATHWLLGQLAVELPDEATRVRILAPPCRSPSALQYYAKAIAAAHQDNVRDVLYYVGESLDYDSTFREAVNLRARLELAAGSAGRDAAEGTVRLLAELARRADDPLDRVNALLALGILAGFARDLDDALQRFETALELARQHGDAYSQIAALGHMTDILLVAPLPTADDGPQRRDEAVRQRVQRAAQWQQRHLALVESLGDVLAEGPSATKLALIYEQLERPDEARDMLTRVLRSTERSGLIHAQAGAWLLLSQFHARRQSWTDALDAVNRSLALARPDARPAIRVSLAGIYEQMKQPVDALGQFELAFEQVRDGDNLADQLLCLRKIATLRKELGRRKEALAALQEAIDLAGILKSPDVEELRKTLEQWRAEGP